MPQTQSRFLLLVLLSALCACSSAPDKRLLQELNRDGFGKTYFGHAEEENYISLGDTVQILDTLHPKDLAASQKVDIDGTILLPELGTVNVAGYTRNDLQAVLTERYSAYYEETDILVQITTDAKKYFIFGEVAREGEQQFEGDLTVFEAVMKAKPKDNTPNLGRVKLIRADPVDPFVIQVNVNDILRGDSTFNVSVQELDIIYVPPTMWAQFAFFIDDLLFPVKQVLQSVGGALFGGNNNNNNRNRTRGVGFGF
ncbi:MAG: hypothetical protein GY711_32795 [bacterium]|nr:hypothetical protein [bacterium]